MEGPADDGRRSSPQMTLPPGQRVIGEFPRFGLTRFANRLPRNSSSIELAVRGDVEEPIVLTSELATLPRVEQVSDFHCVTTWTYRSARWSGYRFADFYRQLAVPRAHPRDDATFVILRGQDGYAPSLPLADLMADDVLLADRLDGEPLSIAHGAPLRLVAPAHYGYKNAKHLKAIEFWRDDRTYRRSMLRFMDHPRARVALEERGHGVPGVLLRYLYRPFIGPTIRQFRRALERDGDGSKI